MFKLIVTIAIILFAVYTVDPEMFNSIKEGAQSIIGTKTGQIKEDVTNSDIISVNNVSYLSVGGITRQCDNDDECNTYNAQCVNNCICRSGKCYKTI